MNTTLVAGPWALASDEEELVKASATTLMEVVDELAVGMARHIHEELPALGTDDEAVEATRASCEANVREMLTMLRAGLPATAHETPSDALTYVRFMRGRGVALITVLRAYELGVSMFQPVAGEEFVRRAQDDGKVQRIAEAVNAFVWVYIERVFERLSAEYSEDSITHYPDPEDPVWRNPASAAAAREFSAAHPLTTNGKGVARAIAERALDDFAARIEAASRNPRLAERLSRADTTVRVEVADEPDLSVTLRLAGDTVEVSDDGPAEAQLRISSVDLGRIWNSDFNLPMAIARGRVTTEGPVRKFLRVVPIVRTLPDPELPDSDGWFEDGDSVESRLEVTGDEDEKSPFDTATTAVLDQAASYEHHQGALAYDEQKAGHFWSIECIDVHKTFGRNTVLNGLNVGIPEGMITVVLGPSGTGKSVLISHLIGLMFPDQGQVLVHGDNVADLRMSELLEMRRKFGILFQDGALFGSMNVYDNVAFPLRQHTDYSEERIADIVNLRLSEVGLEAAGGRVPSELSGGMRKRAGFARALVLEPEIVMFDEPDSGLDPVRTALLCELIQQMHAEHGGTYIVITHDIASARRIADYLVVLWKGRIVQSGDRDDMFTSPNPFVRQFLAGQPRGPLGME
jgi:phospholipid/cholesterol/gamma-HCH transport system ATP-binding protein